MRELLEESLLVSTFTLDWSDMYVGNVNRLSIKEIRYLANNPRFYFGKILGKDTHWVQLGTRSLTQKTAHFPVGSAVWAKWNDVSLPSASSSSSPTNLLDVAILSIKIWRKAFLYWVFNLYLSCLIRTFLPLHGFHNYLPKISECD